MIYFLQITRRNRVQQGIVVATVLVVEDNPDMLDMIAESLRFGGYTVICAQNGYEAYRHLEEGTQPDVLLTDVNMPWMDGLTLLKHIRHQSDWHHMPCIVMSGDKSDGHRAISQGAHEFILKPFHYHELETLLINLV